MSLVHGQNDASLAIFPYPSRETRLPLELSGPLPFFTCNTDTATEKASQAALGKGVRHRLSHGHRAALEQPHGSDVISPGTPPQAGSPAGDSPLQEAAVPHPAEQLRAHGLPASLSEEEQPLPLTAPPARRDPPHPAAPTPGQTAPSASGDAGPAACWELEFGVRPRALGTRWPLPPQCLGSKSGERQRELKVLL